MQCSVEESWYHKERAQRAKTGKMQAVFLNRSTLTTKMLLCILLARLVPVSRRSSQVHKETNVLEPTFAGFPTFCPMTFHLFWSYSLIAASSAALFRFCQHAGNR